MICNGFVSFLQSYEKWLDNQGDLSPISNEGRKLLDQCRVKKKTLRSHEPRVQKLKIKAEELFTSYDQANEDSELKCDVEKFSKMWDTIVDRIGQKLSQLEDMNDMSMEDKFAESSHIISDWINHTESFLLSVDDQVCLFRF